MLFMGFFGRKSCKRKFQEEPKQYESPSDLLTQLDLLESDLSFIMKLTGIWLTNYSKTSVEKSKNFDYSCHYVKRFRL